MLAVTLAGAAEPAFTFEAGAAGARWIAGAEAAPRDGACAERITLAATATASRSAGSLGEETRKGPDETGSEPAELRCASAAMALWPMRL